MVNSNVIENIIIEFVKELEEKVSECTKKLERDLDFKKIEEVIEQIVKRVAAKVLEWIINQVMSKRETLLRLKEWGGRKALKFKEYREVRVSLGNGEKITVKSPYFIKTNGKKGAKKRGPNGRGKHLGLEVMGFIGRCSINLVSEVVQAAILCPSFEVAETVLKRRGIKIDLKTIRRLCEDLGKRGIEFRGKISMEGEETISGHTLVIGIDGGRIRERVNKRGRKKKGQKRQGFYSDWKEPKLFTIYLEDKEGEIIREFAPLHDATMGDHKVMFALLTKYLQALNLSTVSRIVFTGDGSDWIWNGVKALLIELNLEPQKVYQVLDYTHAKQNLQEIIDLVSLQNRTLHKIEQRWKELLWNGDLTSLYAQICLVLSGKKKEYGLKKFNNYFVSNQHRMQYASFKQQAIPCGSGCVESAIRRVINLRLKSPGSFWKSDMAEYFLFLRSQLLSGRWDIFILNLSSLARNLIRPALVFDVVYPSINSSPFWLEAA